MHDKSEKALAYCRVSDSKQRLEGSGLPSQQHRCAQYILEKGYSLEKSFHDDFTGGGVVAPRVWRRLCSSGYVDSSDSRKSQPDRMEYLFHGS